MPVSLLDERQHRTEDQTAEALFKEARRRRRRRWFVSGIITLSLVLIGTGVGIAANRGGPRGSQPTSVGSGGGTATAVPGPRPGKVSVPVLTYTPAFSVGVAGDAVWMANGTDIYLTTDGGTTWQTITPSLLIGADPGYRSGPMVGVGSHDLWLPVEDVPGLAERVPDLIPPGSASVRGSGIERSTDGGQTWQFTPLPGCVQTCGANISLSFTDAEHGFASIGPDQQGTSALFATTDGGTTWALVSDLPRTPGARILFTNDVDGWMVNANESVDGGGEEGSLFQTTDGGVSWHQAPGLPMTDSFQLPTFFGQDGVVLEAPPGDVPNPPVVFTTDDGGSSWTPHPPPYDPATGRWASPGVGIPFSASTYTDWSLFVGPELYATANAGGTWARALPTPTWQPDEMQSMVFATPEEGWAVAQRPGCSCYSVLMSTLDGGEHWSPRNP